MYQKCPICKGKGLLKKEPCPTCLGERIIHAEYGTPPSKMFVIPYFPSYPIYPETFPIRPWEITYASDSLNPQMSMGTCKKDIPTTFTN
jgi:hypothetical protein